MQPISLSELNAKIKESLAETFPLSLPIAAEISELNYNRNGHCYLELIEQQEQRIISKARAIIYANRYPLLQSYFKSVTGGEFQVGMKILFMAKVTYHAIYGVNLEIIDIDPAYTLGDFEQQRRLIIQRLYNEGVVDMNKNLPLPPFIKKIAVVSSPTAAGYDDFMKHLNNNPYGFSFDVDLYEAFMQGNQAVDSIYDAVARIFHSAVDYDVVVLLRGGGSKAELAIFDTYELAYLITQIPIPVITGIGHERDFSVCDMMANQSMKTPTAVADFIINRNLETFSYLVELQKKLYDIVERVLQQEKIRILAFESQVRRSVSQLGTTYRDALNRIEKRILKIAVKRIHNHYDFINGLHSRLYRSFRIPLITGRNNLENIWQRLKSLSQAKLASHTMKISLCEQKLALLNPQEILNQGYAILSKESRRVTSIQELSRGDKVKIYLSQGNCTAEITDSTSN